jgi:hypothetical protein
VLTCGHAGCAAGLCRFTTGTGAHLTAGLSSVSGGAGSNQQLSVWRATQGDLCCLEMCGNPVNTCCVHLPCAAAWNICRQYHHGGFTMPSYDTWRTAIGPYQTEVSERVGWWVNEEASLW